jgi:phosphocarrier protein
MIGELCMVSQTIIVTGKASLHLRPASELSKIASKCKSSIIIMKDDKQVNPKSILNLLNADIKNGDRITIQCTGVNEAQDLITIINAIQGKTIE